MAAHRGTRMAGGKAPLGGLRSAPGRQPANLRRLWLGTASAQLLTDEDLAVTFCRMVALPPGTVPDPRSSLMRTSSWIASANATPDVSDDAIRAKEDAAAVTLAGHNRHSISIDARDPWFAPRLQHLRTFLPEQSAGCASPTCACLQHSRWRGAHAPLPRDLSDPRFPAPAPLVTLTPVVGEAKVNALKAQ